MKNRLERLHAEYRHREKENTMNKSRELILDQIDEATAPGRMMPSEALDFLSTLAEDLTGRIEALIEENPQLGIRESGSRA